MTTDAVVAEEPTGPELVAQYLSERFESRHSRYIRVEAPTQLRRAVLDCVRRRGSTDDRTWRLGSRDPSVNERTTRNSYLSELHSFYEWAFGNRLLPTDPTVGIERRQHKPAPPCAISVDDLAAAVDAADPKMRAWLLLASGAGCTVQEIAALTPSDVLDRQTSSPSLRIRGGKGGRTRGLFLFAQTFLRRSMRPLPTRQPVG